MPQGAHKLWHADYRPDRSPRKSGSRFPKRFPFFRIILLLALATLLYLRFDSLWPMMIRTLQVKPSPLETAGPILKWKFDTDSTHATLTCEANLQSCLKAAEKMRLGMGNEVGSLLRKAAWLHGWKEPQLEGLSVAYPVAVSDPCQVLFSVRGRDGDGPTFRYHRKNDGLGSWCEDKKGCLEFPKPEVPMRGAYEFREGWFWLASASPEIHPALPGTVVRLDSSASENFSVTLYHGRESYSHYQNLSQLAGGLTVGQAIRPSTVLGLASRIDSTHFAARFRAERAGMGEEIFPPNAEATRGN